MAANHREMSPPPPLMHRQGSPGVSSSSHLSTIDSRCQTVSATTSPSAVSAPPSRPASRAGSRKDTNLGSALEHNSSRTKLSSPPPSSSTRAPRFEVFQAGTPQESHAHHLRPSRRQEKLGRMLKDFFRVSHNQANGSGKAEDEDDVDRDAEDAVAAVMGETSNQPPSLLSGLVRELRQNSRDPGVVLDEILSAHSKQVGESNFVERYGRLSDVVGKGSFGVVRLAHKVNPADKRRKLVYAVKEYHPNNGESESHYLKRLASEFCLSSSLHHTNIIHSLDLLRDGRNRYCGVMEYCAGGDLYSLIVVAGKLEPKESNCYFKQIVRGIAYMHDMGVAHRDLKPENILLTSRGCIKITDFGNAECFRMAWEKDIHMSNNICGSGPYIAPEEYTKSQFDPRPVDMWSVGIIYMAMRTGQQMWQVAKPSDEFYARYLKGRKDKDGYEVVEKLTHARCRNVIYSILDPVASRRLNARQVLNSEWGREIVVCDAGDGKRYDEEAHHCARSANVYPHPVPTSLIGETPLQ